MKNDLTLSSLPHTWFIDLDGTILEHNAHLTQKGDILLPGAKEFLAGIPEKDTVIFLTSRKECYRETTESFLKKNSIYYDGIIFSLPYGERIIINDKKESGLRTCHAVNLERNQFDFSFKEDEKL